MRWEEFNHNDDADDRVEEDKDIKFREQNVGG
jgi:hypothetical protein